MSCLIWKKDNLMDYLEAFKLHKFLLTAVDKSHQLVVDKSLSQLTGCSRSESTH